MSEKPPSYNTATNVQGGTQQYGYGPPPGQVAPPYGGAPPPAGPIPQGYPQPVGNPGYPQPPQQPQIIVTSQTYDPFRFLRPTPTATGTFGNSVMLGPTAVGVKCPSCQHDVTTIVQAQPTSKTHLFAALMCLFGCWPCCLIPYCMDDCQGRTHTCPNCGAYLGTFEN